VIYQNFDKLIDLVQTKSGKKSTVAVVAAEDSHTLEAVIHATKDGIVVPMLIGNGQEIQKQLTALNESPADYIIIHTETVEDAALKAAELVRDGHANFIMKGLIPTNKLMRTLLSEAAGFRTGNLISHISFVQIPNYHKLIGITDVAINISPDLQQKKGIVENAVNVMKRMGFDTPKVAILTASEEVSAKMPETVDAAELKKLNQEGSLQGCIIEGPMSYDLAISREAGEIKGMGSPVYGDVDLMVVPNIAAGNILLKALRYSAQARTAGFIIGGKVPIVLTSRAAEVDAKYLPLVLAACATIID